MDKKVISFSLWGDQDLYNIGAVANAKEALEVYPGWVCRFYAHESSTALKRLNSFPNTEVVLMPDEPVYAKSFWRFFAASDPQAELVVFRDCDSRIGWRERAAVDEWISSEKSAHVMRDVEAHSHEVMLSGMWGVRRNVFPNMVDLCRKWISSHDMGRKETDELFLKDVIWPKVSSSVLCHGFSYHGGGIKAKPFPPHAPWRGEYVGMVIHPSEADIKEFRGDM